LDDGEAHPVGDRAAVSNAKIATSISAMTARSSAVAFCAAP
jgi:hypothetical protein